MRHPVPAAYSHYPKAATLHGSAAVNDATIKLYYLAAPATPVQDSAQDAVATWLERDGPGILAPGDMGFAIVHRCGASFYFLLVSVWREANELWQAVWYRDDEMALFTEFDPAYPPRAGSFRPTFCVWELAIVAHESQAWARFLKSPRDEAAFQAWLADSYEGDA